MADYKSDQITQLDSVPRQHPKSNEIGGRIRAAFFSFTVPTGDVATTKTIALTRIPKGARILKGHVAFEAMSTGAGDASIQIGVSGTAAKYLGTTSVDTAGSASFAHTIALNQGEELSAETEILATVVTEAWAATKKLQGFVEYVVD